ncbi:hypothetical protein [Terribacillus saccharophilus]|nr:hypothetical protein [Terribacillus goriensis]
MELNGTDYIKVISFIENQLQDAYLSRKTKVELMAHKRIIERMMELEAQD